MDKNLIERYTVVYNVGLNALTSGFTYMDSVNAEPIYNHNVALIHHIKGAKGDCIFLISDDETPGQSINTFAMVFKCLFENCALHEMVSKAFKMAIDGVSKEAADNLVKAFEDAFSNIDPDDAMKEMMSIFNKKKDKDE